MVRHYNSENHVRLDRPSTIVSPGHERDLSDQANIHRCQATGRAQVDHVTKSEPASFLYCDVMWSWTQFHVDSRCAHCADNRPWRYVPDITHPSRYSQIGSEVRVSASFQIFSRRRDNIRGRGRTISRTGYLMDSRSTRRTRIPDLWFQ